MTQAPAFQLDTSRGFSEWFDDLGGAIAFSTYQGGKLFVLGKKPDGTLWVHERSFPRPMGLSVSNSGNTFYMASQYQLYRFDNVMAQSAAQGVNDALFAPHASWITGDIDIHDIGVKDDGRPVFVNTLFNCLATVSDGHSFRPIWKPPFISRIAAEDRCHLNGLAMDGSDPRFVTTISRSDAVDGWRDRRTDGGLVIDVASNEIVAEGLSMPHSPRMKYRELWLLNSGTGELGHIDVNSGRFEPVAFCPGYARGLAFAGHFALVGLSLPRGNKTLTGLPLDDALAKHDAEPRCGLLVIDTRTGDTVAWVRIEGVITELFDVALLPNVRCPAVVGLMNTEVHRVISIEESSS